MVYAEKKEFHLKVNDSNGRIMSNFIIMLRYCSEHVTEIQE